MEQTPTTFGEVPEGQSFLVVNVVAGRVVDKTIFVKIKPFVFKSGRPPHNYVYTDHKGRRHTGTLGPGDQVVVA